jgi:hypothetical protein
MKPSGDNYQARYSHSMHNAGEIVEHPHASKMSVYARNCSVSMQPVAIVLLIDPLRKDRHAVMDK